MKAAYINQFGGPEVLKFGDLIDPEAADGEVVIDVHAASQDEVSKRQGCHAAVAQIEMNEAPFQINAGCGRGDPASTFGHLTSGNDHMQRRNRAGRHFRQHRREHQMVIAADDDDLNRVVELSLQMLGQCYPGKTAADNNDGK